VSLAFRDQGDGDSGVRTLATVITFLLTLAVNGAANALPLNGQTTAAISDRFQVFVIPAGYVFGIWGVIYLGLGAYTVYQALHADDPVVRRLGWLPAISNVLNAAWIPLFHYEAFALTVVVMVGLLLTLLAIHRRLWSARHELTRATFWTIRVPFSIYLGWITVATIANVAQTVSAFGFDGLAIPGEWLAAIVLLGVFAIAARFIWQFNDVAYGLVMVWAYVGIAIKEATTAIVPWIAAAASVGIGMVIAVRALGGGQLRLRR
jgi:hypothetical protein